MRNKIKIGILGAGSMARTHLEALRTIDGAKVVGVSGARPESLGRIEREFGVNTFDDRDALLERVDAVDICLPTFLHEEAARAAAAAKVHALCEKPIALEPVAARRMIRACDKAGVILMVAHCLRFWPEYRFLKDAADDGRFGTPLSFEGWRYNCMPARSSGDWLLDDEKSGGPAIDLHIHDTDMIRFLFGNPAAVRATEIKTELIRSISSEFSYNGGPLARAEAGWFFSETYKFHMGYRAVFGKAVVEYHSQLSPAIKVTEPGKEEWHPELEPEKGYRGELYYFVECVRNRREPSLGSAKDALESLALVCAARRAAAAGRAVRFA